MVLGGLVGHNSEVRGRSMMWLAEVLVGFRLVYREIEGEAGSGLGVSEQKPGWRFVVVEVQSVSRQEQQKVEVVLVKRTSK
jgi:hypothetical protein